MTSFVIGKPLPRAADAYVEDEKWTGWILAAHGHGADWYRRFGRVVAHEIWHAIVDGLAVAPVANSDSASTGVTCGVQMSLTLNDRTAPVRTAWHYDEPGAAPRLLTAYPTT
jgi:hypothetical protein